MNLTNNRNVKTYLECDDDPTITKQLHPVCLVVVRSTSRTTWIHVMFDNVELTISTNELIRDTKNVIDNLKHSHLHPIQFGIFVHALALAHDCMESIDRYDEMATAKQLHDTLQFVLIRQNRIY
jgi:hypothetical protein